YVVDFICLERRLIVEVDGGQHAIKKNSMLDRTRINFLEDRGFSVLRFWNNEVMNSTESVLASILYALQSEAFTSDRAIIVGEESIPK
ncbi:MAG: endonuclease domain-containing protein, partial [Gammaproteobacteria bacterium]